MSSLSAADTFQPYDTEENKEMCDELLGLKLKAQ
jgi:hypothetical protein